MGSYCGQYRHQVCYLEIVSLYARVCEKFQYTSAAVPQRMQGSCSL